MKVRVVHAHWFQRHLGPHAVVQKATRAAPSRHCRSRRWP